MSEINNIIIMIDQGNTAEIYRMDDNKILKLFRSGLYRGIIEKEYQNSIIIQNVLECVPKVYEMVEIKIGITHSSSEIKRMDF